MIEKKSIPQLLSTVKYLPNRTPESGFNGETAGVFALVSQYRDGAIYTGHYSGSSEWERHSNGDEIVFALEGTTTVVLLAGGSEQRIQLNGGELVVVPKGVWHRFEGSNSLKVFSVTPTPTDHSLSQPDA
jgi:mannose-6-phosphate isomerase-like protein (cupin superfamily)